MKLESKLKVIQEYRNRYIWLLLAVFVIFIALMVRLAYLQVVNGEAYRRLSQHNFVQERVVPTLRGRILDVDGRVLAGNRPAYNAYLTPAFVENFDATMTKLEGYLNLSEQQSVRMHHQFENARGLMRFRQIMIMPDISRSQLALLESNKLQLPGVSIHPGPRRDYLHGELMSHAIGYVGRITERELKHHPDYLQSDQIGKKGLEKAFEDVLRGRHGLQRVVVDAQGRIKGRNEARLLLQDDTSIDPVPGDDLLLSLDLDLQQAAEKAFTGKAGALVAMDVNTGFIKVWLSQPGFDPNLFVGGISQLDWERYRNSILKPLMDKVAQGSYFPGSTYKVVPAVAALESGEIAPQAATHCSGARFLGKHAFHCWKRSGHGTVSLHLGLKQSCDVYFYWIGEKLGFDVIRDYSSKFGLGEAPGVGINNETAGVLPTREWHREAHGRAWFPGDTLSHVIGQGDLKVSPLQLAVLYAAIANGGKVMRPQLVTRIQKPDGTVIEAFSPEIKRNLNLPPETLKPVREALSAVVNEQGGTGYLSRLIEPEFAGKTGTAQVVRLPQNKRAHDDYLLKDHAWFVAFAPVENPQIVVVGLVEHGEHGSWVAPAVRDVIAAWYEKHTGTPAEYPAWRWESPLKEMP